VLQLHHGYVVRSAALSWSDIDTKNRILHVLHGSTCRRRLIPRGKTKNNGRCGYPISEAVLRFWRLTRHDRRLTASMGVTFDVARVEPDKLVFTSRGNASPSRNLSAIFNKVRDKRRSSQTRQRPRCDTLHNSHVNAANALMQIAKLHGHKDLSMLTKVYAHLGKDVVTAKSRAVGLLPA